MHVKEDSLYDLAAAHLQGAQLTEEQGRQQKHLGECRECYERFCAYLTVMDLTCSAFWALEDGGEDDRGTEDVEENVLLRIQLAGALIASICPASGNAASWSFLHMPGRAAARGAGDGAEPDIYVNGKSEYSQICADGQRLVVQLDGEVFPIGHLGVRYEEDGRTVIRRLDYNEDTECYETVIDRSGRTDSVTVEIVWM